MSDKEEEVINLIVNERQNVFLTGPAGTGKSTMLQTVVRLLRAHSRTVATTASTGIAAYNISGVTFHRFVGCLLAKGTPERLADRIRERPELLAKWKSVEVLIIDEISMIGADFFQRIEKTARLVRETHVPFGGIQILAVGDFLQLPPVKARQCFHAKSWHDVIKHTIHLDKVFRQTHPRFMEVLSRLRLGQADEQDNQWLRENLERKLTLPDGVEPTYTVCCKKEADRINNGFLRKRKGPSQIYNASDIVVGEIDHCDIDRECIMKRKLRLRIGAKVMLTYNYSDNFVNGSTGTVIGFTNGLPAVRFNSGRELTVEHVTWQMDVKSSQEQTRVSKTGVNTETGPRLVASRRQLPLILAWAITIHKSQGQTLDWQIAIVTNVFETGQLYTALSRASDPTRLQVVGYDPKKNRICRDTLAFYNSEQIS